VNVGKATHSLAKIRDPQELAQHEAGIMEAKRLIKIAEQQVVI
jgi:hypothetical protein